MYVSCNNVPVTDNTAASLLILCFTSDSDDSLADVVSLQHPHKSSWHVFKAFCDVLPTMQLALQIQNK